MSIAEATQQLSHGTLLCNMYLGPEDDLVIGSSDLEDFYHCFKTSPEHAARNHVHGVFPAEVFEGWNCWNPSLKGKLVVGCFGTLAMGTNYAVEVAQRAHMNLLQRAGCLKISQLVRYRHPLPRGKVLQLLCIDDYAVLQHVPRGLLPRSVDGVSKKMHERQDIILLDKAIAAYKKEGLRVSKHKIIKNSKRGVVLGGEINGELGTVRAPCLRVLALCKLTLRLISIGHATKELIQSILGCWVFVLLFRRPLLSILSDIFHEGDSQSKADTIFELSTGAKQELLLLCLWAPFAYTNMRSYPSSRLFCTDASLTGAGVCWAPVTPHATLELSRQAEMKGFYTRVDTSTLAKFNALHGDSIWKPDKIPRSLQEGFLWDFCEIFRGSGVLSQAHAEAGLCVHPGFDLKDGDHGDVLNPATFLAIVGLISRRVVRAFHVAPICKTFGTFVTPQLRSTERPFGFDPTDLATARGNCFAIRAAFILHLCHHYQLVGTGEQPAGSVMFRLNIFERLLSFGFQVATVSFCNWGTPFESKSI